MKKLPEQVTALFRRYLELPSPVILHTLFGGDDTAFRNAMKNIRPHCDTTTLASNMKVYRLTAAAANQHDVVQNRKPPSEKQLKQFVATACYCLLSTPPRVLVTRRELRDRFQHLYTDTIRTDRYYFNTNDDGIPIGLTSILVDTGKSIEGLLKDNRKEVARHIERLPMYRRLALTEDRLSIVIVTTTPTRAANIQRAFAGERPRYDFWQRIPVSVEPQSTYAQLFSTPPKKKEAA